MLRIFQLGFLLFMCLQIRYCNAQDLKKNSLVLSEDFDTSMPFHYKIPQNLTAKDTCPAFRQKGRKILLTGTVYQADGKTPAPNVILYYYQTNSDGIYATNEREERNMPKNRLGQTHGYLRGWLKTDEQGKYFIYTTQPGTYPSRNEPAHIHLTVLEKQLNQPYYLDDFVFDNDPLLTTQRRKRLEHRGGSGIIRFVEKEGILIGERNIILGLNIPDYPKPNKIKFNSGKDIGENILSFTPYHAYGPDKGSSVCPICKYGWYHGILYFIGNQPNWNEIKEWLVFLEDESRKREEYLKVYLVYGNEQNYSKENRIQLLEKIGEELQLKKVALTFVPSFNDQASEVYLNKIDPNLENTFLIYKRSTVIDKFINLHPNENNFKKIINGLDQSMNEYFWLERAKQ